MPNEQGEKGSSDVRTPIKGTIHLVILSNEYESLTDEDEELRILDAIFPKPQLLQSNVERWLAVAQYNNKFIIYRK